MIAFAVIAAVVIALVVYMLRQKPVTTAQKLIQLHQYDQAANDPTADPIHRAEALKLSGRFEEAIASYRQSDDLAAQEGIALCLAHLGRDLDEAQRMMERQIALHPQIQEFQALGLAYILLKQGKRDEAMRVFEDNVELLETRFRDDYTDPDPLLAETLFMYGVVGDSPELRAKAARWAPGSAFAKV